MVKVQPCAGGEIAGYFSKEKDFLISCTDVGMWTLQVFYSDGSKDEYSCSLQGGYNTLTRDVRRLVDIPSLFGFSGENGRAITLMKACKARLCDYADFEGVGCAV